MKEREGEARPLECESLNESLLPLDLENPEVEELEQRLELAIASLPIGVEQEDCFRCIGFSCEAFKPPP
jgi:hypothetical protein